MSLSRVKVLLAGAVVAPIAVASGAPASPAAAKHALVPGKDLKLASPLARVARKAETATLAAAFQEARRLALAFSDGDLRVVVEGRPAKTRRVLGAIRGLDGRVELRYGNLVRTLMPISALEALSRDSAVHYIRAPRRFTADAVAGEGIAASNVSAWQASGLTGLGVTVAIIDLGFAGYQERQAEGELPATVETVDYCNGNFAADEDHGTGVAEIVHEVAPAANLMLICIADEVGLGRAFVYARNNGAEVINHSVSWFNTSRGDDTGAPGSPTAIVAAARAAGILWINSAGNEAKRHWNGTFTSTDGDNLLDFSGGDESNAVVLQADDEFCADLKWDDWPASAQDYDLRLVNGSGAVVAQSNTLQNGSQAPVEEVCYTASVSASYGLEIRRASGSASPRLDLFSTRNLEYAVAEGSVTEPASSPSAFAAAAICWQNGALEPFSSQGPTIDGRIKPDIAAFDSVSSVTYGAFSECGTTGFVGTSAAAPHVAGAAALVKEAVPYARPADLQSFLQTNSLDLGVAGGDNLFGAGKLLLPNATPPLPASAPPHQSTFTDADNDGAGGADIASVQVANAASRALTFRVAVSNRGALNSNESIQIEIDSDLNEANDNGGAEYNIAVWPDGQVILSRWNGSGDETIRYLRASSVTGGLATFTLNWNEVPLGLNFNFRVGSWSGSGRTDNAPNRGFWSYPSASLTVEKDGDGAGSVTSNPGGIDCGGTCTATFSSATSVALTATPAVGSQFVTWSEPTCEGATCIATVDRRTIVTAEFALIKCEVPQLKRKTLRAARALLGRSHCRLGQVKRAFSKKVKKGRVSSQRPAAGAERPNGAPVSVVVSRGRKPPPRHRR